LSQQFVAILTEEGKKWSGKIEKVEEKFVQLRYDDSMLIHVPICMIEEVTMA
jgi:ribosome maturation factor RimP